MRISTNLMFDRASRTMSDLSGKADALNTRIATGRKFAAPSGDAAAYRQLSALKRAATDQEADTANIKLAQSLLSSADTALSGVEVQLQRAREIAVQAGTGTLSAQQKAAFGTELDAIVDDLVTLANATDSRGQPLFGGATDAVPFVVAADGTVGYAGSGEAGAIPIGADAGVAATTPGDRAFGVSTAGGASDIFAVVQALAASLRATGTAGTALDDLATALSTVTDTRASIGARGARLDIEASRLSDTALTREATRSAIEDADPYQTYADLQKTLTVLQATQASFGKLTALSMFDYLR